MTFSPTRLLTTHALTAALIFTIAAPVAGAAESSYPPDLEAREFTTSQGGWTESSSYEGTCVPPATCPTVTNSHQSAGGVGDDGFIRSSFLGVLGVGGTSTGTWQSPPFLYSGAGGQSPTSVRFTMSRRADVADLLAVAGNAATYAVELVDLSAGSTTVPVVAPTSLSGAEAWTPISPVSVNPAALVGGHEYRLRITSTYSAGASLLVTGSADYDNVELRADHDPSQGGGKGGGGAGPGAGSGAGGDQRRLRGGGMTWQQMLAILLRRSPRQAVLRGKRLFVKVNCPAKIGRSCRIRVQAFLRERKPVTNIRTVKIGKGKGRQVALRVRKRWRPRVAKLKRLLVREKVRAGNVRAYFWKVRKLIRRR